MSEYDESAWGYKPPSSNALEPTFVYTFANEALRLLADIKRIQAEEHRQARNFRTLMWVLFWLTVLAALVVGIAVAAATKTIH